MNIIQSNTVETVVVSSVLSGMTSLYIFTQLNVRTGVFKVIHLYLNKMQKKKKVMIGISIKYSTLILVGVFIVNSFPKGIFLGFLLALLEMIFVEDSIENI